jgi:hypothetical protein
VEPGKRIAFANDPDARRKVAGPAATSVTVKGLRAGPAVVRAQAVNKNGISKAVVTTITVPKSRPRRSPRRP